MCILDDFPKTILSSILSTGSPVLWPDEKKFFSSLFFSKLDDVFFEHQNYSLQARALDKIDFAAKCAHTRG